MLPRSSRTRRHTRLKWHQVVPTYQSRSKARRCAPVAQQSANGLFGPVQQRLHDLLGHMARCGDLVDQEGRVGRPHVVNRVGQRLEDADDRRVFAVIRAAMRFARSSGSVGSGRRSFRAEIFRPRHRWSRCPRGRAAQAATRGRSEARWHG
jgi:hypothetical protein